jgi:Ni/Co efflux regulator RcnB
MIDEPGHPTGHLAIALKRRTTMLKTISTALLAVSVLAAPALAASSGKTAQAPAAKTAQVKPSALNANAQIGRHHVKHVRHHRLHKKMTAIKKHHFSKATIKHVTPATKRG